MAEPRILRIYLDPNMLASAQAGTFGFVRVMTEAFEAEDFRVELRKNSFEERMKSGARNGYSMFLMDEPFHEKALTMRKAYYYPFWRIENVAERWEFAVAHRAFDPAEIDPVKARKWFGDWRKWIFRKLPERAEKLGLIYVPLQGRLLEHRSFQTMSPLEMIGAVQAQAGDRRILLGLHPGEAYSEDEITAVTAIAKADPRVTLQTGGMEEALRTCDLVVTMNSTAALSGYFFQKPAVLFAKSDFHHVMPNVAALGVDEAFRRAEAETPDFAAYLYWFIQLNSIKADAPGAGDAILATCRAHWSF
ncbi:hypothetical protein [uncultured Maritimibacter sp.]|jgi:hypothetical protein|uniref:hypothetical protein n=1 Tax=uncultured Maritimibacter sp. TaxID=991866 RepID=UPI002631845C|nr:hypothetical protein [uncultured Maritimibacter sp.]